MSREGFAQGLLWPLQSEPGLAASFCEFRPRHFHSGVDIKTWGVRSRPCIAIADGVISRVKVQATGYGKALYLTMRDGRTAVYAHLDKFAPPIADRVRAIQESTGNFEVDLFWEGDSATTYKRGDIVAYSGVTGTVHPHLHFEIRDAGQGPLNPLTNGLYIADHLPPIPVGIAVTPLDRASTVEGDFQTRLYPRLLRQPNGIYTPGDPIGASGRIGISVDAYDQADAATNEMAAYKLELDVSGETYWTTEFDGFAFDQTKMIEIERDYRLQRRGKGSYHRLYRLQGNRLRFVSGDGVIDAGLADPYPIDILITLSDASGNTSKIEFQLVSDMVDDSSRGVGGQPLIGGNGWSHRSLDEIGIDWFDDFLRLSAQPGVSFFSIESPFEEKITALNVQGGVAAGWNPPQNWTSNTLISALDEDGTTISQRTIAIARAYRDQSTTIIAPDSQCILEIPPGALYDDSWIELEPEGGYGVPGQVEAVYRVEPRDQPIAGQVKIKIRRPPSIANAKGWGVYYYNSRLGWTFLGREEEGEYLSGYASSWDRYALVYDGESPTLSVGLPKVAETTDSKPELSAVVKDATSGISSSGISVKLDGRKVPAEYDQPRARIYYRPWKSLTAGRHTYELEIKDRAGNSTHKSVSITTR